MKIWKAFLLIILIAAVGFIVFVRFGGDRAPVEATEAPAASPEPTPLVFEEPPTEYTGVLNEEQLLALDTSALQYLNLTGSTCYEAIERFHSEHPDVELVYAVLLEGENGTLALDPDSVTVELEDGSVLTSLIENLSHLPALTGVTIAPDAADPAQVDALREAAPELEVAYEMHLGEELVPYDIEELTLTGMDGESLAALIPQLEKLTHLQAVSVPESENSLSLEEALALSEQSDVIRLDYQIELFGQQLSLDAESIEFENADIGKEGLEVLKTVLPYFRNLKYLKLDDCGIDNETMAQLRDDYPDIKVVWRVYFGSYHCLTDTEMIWATGGSVNDTTSGVLKYCTDVKYLDLGHSLITHADFLNYMPKLEVAILAISWLEDISPLSNCPNLEYLELFSARVSDLSPLAKCTHLQHLNIGSQRNSNNVAVGPTDISSLYDLPEIKRFYCTMSYVPEEQQKEIMSRHPDCEFEFRWVDPAEGYWRFKDGNMNNNSKDNRNERYALLCEQFGYDTYQQSGKMWSLYG
ncbi:MAG: hypothetical protein IK149_04440 [Oscillospiraceae bacterium]|nr:hypothetical protein [Oscillospiraceae bacterium]